MIYREEQREGCCVISPEGSFGEEPLHELEEAVTRHEKDRVVMDLAQVTRINSQGVTFILSAWRRLRRSGGGFILAAARGKVNEVFEITRIGSFVPMAGDVAEAVRRLNEETR